MKRASIFALCLLGTTAQAHDVGMGALQITETGPHRYMAHWRLQQASDGVYPQWPEGCSAESLVVQQTWELRCRRGLAGETITFERRANKGVDVVASVTWRDGATHTQLLRRADPWKVPPAGAAPASSSAWRYAALGIEHILIGWDHLLFLVVLAMIVARLRTLLAAVTAFTLGHSLTLAWAVLRGHPVPLAPLEACIALSVAVVAAAAARAPQSVSTRRLAGVTLLFGLIHGLGFASALSDVGLPEDARALPLLSFNIGVEVGQLMLLVVIWPLLSLGRTHVQRRPVRLAWTASLYLTGALACFWVIERVYAGLRLG